MLSLLGFESFFQLVNFIHIKFKECEIRRNMFACIAFGYYYTEKSKLCTLLNMQFILVFLVEMKLSFGFELTYVTPPSVVFCECGATFFNTIKLKEK